MRKQEMVIGMIPKGVDTILDIGCENNLYKDYNVTTLDYLIDSDINHEIMIDKREVINNE